MNPSRDHQVNHSPMAVLDADGNAFADAAQLHDCATFKSFDGWADGAQQKWTTETNLLDWLANDSHLQRGEIRRDVGQFRHGLSLHGTEPHCNMRSGNWLEAGWVVRG
jgi:hypothetical protein